jgi:lipoprotein signal peptidase
LTGLAVCATAVAVADLATKQIAAAVLGAHGAIPIPLFGHAVRLAMVLNDQSAFGVSLGAYTWHINLLLTFLALVLSVALCRALAVLDVWAPIMLGLIAGAATGNLVSLIASPHGVLDFIAVRSGGGGELVFNVADIAAVLGVLLIFRTVWTVGRAILRNARGG